MTDSAPGHPTGPDLSPRAQRQAARADARPTAATERRAAPTRRRRAPAARLPRRTQPQPPARRRRRRDGDGRRRLPMATATRSCPDTPRRGPPEDGERRPTCPLVRRPAAEAAPQAADRRLDARRPRAPPRRDRRRRRRGRAGPTAAEAQAPAQAAAGGRRQRRPAAAERRRPAQRPAAGGRAGRWPAAVAGAGSPGPGRAHRRAAVDLDDDVLERRRGRERKGRPVGRYLMAVHVARRSATQIAVLEGRALIEHYVSRPADDVAQIHGNIYLGKVQNVLPGMEAAFVDIGTPKNAVLYRGDVHYDPDDLEPSKGKRATCASSRCSRPGRRSSARSRRTRSGPRAPASPRRCRCRAGSWCSSRTAPPTASRSGCPTTSASASADPRQGQAGGARPHRAHGGRGHLRRGARARRRAAWSTSGTRSRRLRQASQAPALLYREPDMALRVIREEFNQRLPGGRHRRPAALRGGARLRRAHQPGAGRPGRALRPGRAEALPLFERLHVHEQLHKALDRKVWLPSGGSLIIERTEALTVIDVNTGKNVGTSSLEETVFRNNLEAADEVARQLRLRDIGGIIVIDFIDMEIRPNRDEVIRTFREALARDKTRTQVFDISELGPGAR